MSEQSKMGRPKKEISEDKLRSLLRMYPTLKDTAAFFECSEDTIEKRCQEYANCTFTELREQSMVHTRLNLVRKALEMADKGNTPLMIFCLKNLCGWSDKYEAAIDPRQAFQIVFNDKPKLVK